MGRNLPIVLVMRWVVRVRNRGLGAVAGWAGGRAGLGVGVGVVGPARMVSGKEDQEGCALIGLGAEIWDIHRG